MKKSGLMTYFNDEALESPLDDQLGYSHFAFYLAKCILDIKKAKNSYVIGVYGKWGDGKTSAINMALEYLSHLIKNPNMSLYDINDKIKEEKEEEPSREEETDKAIANWRLKSNAGLAFIVFFSLIFTFLFISPLPVLLNTYVFKSPFQGDYLLKLFIQLSVIYFIIEKFSSPSISLLLSPIYIKEPALELLNQFNKLSTKQDFIQVKFDPWNYTNRETILKEFFKQLSIEIESQIDTEYIKSTAQQISIYAKLILDKDISVIEGLFQDNDVKALKESISAKLEKSSKKVIIVIDDIDRLLPEESLLIFQIVRLIANFPNVIYILSLDKEKICQDLQVRFEINSEDFIKKIIQIEKTLPITSNTTMKNSFLEFINDQTSEYNFKNAHEFNTLFEFGLQGKYINNIRDLNRFFNSFNFLFQAYKKEGIHIVDLAAIIAVEVFEYPLYRFIRENKDLLCGLNVVIYSKDDCKIYTKEGQPQCLIDFCTKINKFNNIAILVILFPSLFTAIKRRVKEYKDKELLNPELLTLYNSINENLESLKDIDRYRRLSNYIFFNNYFRHNFDSSSLTNKEKEKIFSCYNNLDEFKTTLMSLYKNNPEKVIDFINYWGSSYNKAFRTKDNTLLYLRNFLCLGKKEKEIINFLNKYNFFYNISRSFIRDFTAEQSQSDSRITLLDIYNLINESIDYFNSNIIFFLYFILCRFKFPMDDDKDPILNEYESTYFHNIIAMIKHNIKDEGILKSPEALSALNYLKEFFCCEIYVNNFIKMILAEDNEQALLKILLTGRKGGKQHFQEFALVKEFFLDIGKDIELKNKLLDIKYENKYWNLYKNEEFIIANEYGITQHIADVVLELLIADIKLCIELDNLEQSFETYEGKEQRLQLIVNRIKDLSDKEINFALTISLEHEISKIQKLLAEIKSEEPQLFEKYKEQLNIFLV